MPDTIAIQILKKIRKTKGCSVHDLEEALPKQYDFTDIPRHYYLGEPLVRLMKWGLIQAFRENRLVDPVEIEQEKIPLRVLRFFLSPLAATMEDALGFSFGGSTLSIFGEPTKSENWPHVFVLMPFASDLRPVFDDHMKKVAKDVGVTIGRADDFFSAGSIVQDIWSAISAASIIVADCTGRNPNVFYEIGISHTIGKDTILISQSLEDVPFDLRHLRVIIYEFTPRGMAEFETKFRATLGGASR
jgi:hypothetical protein